MTRNRRAWLLLWVGAIGLIIATPSLAHAHASVARSDPPRNASLEVSPEHVTAWFSEELHPGFSMLQVLDVDGQQVDNGDSYVLPDDIQAMTVSVPPLNDGMYTVVWRTLSGADGHTMRGSFVFFVGEFDRSQATLAPQTPLLQSPLDPLIRWLVTLTALASTGGIAFYVLVLRPSLLTAGLTDLGLTLGRRLARWSTLAGLAFLVASLLQLGLQAAVVHDIPLWRAPGTPALAVIGETDWGFYWLWRIGLITTFVVTMQILRRWVGSERGGEGPVVWGSLAAGAAMLLPISMTSHTGAVSGLRLEGSSTDYLHFLAAALWMGAIFHFALMFTAIKPLPTLTRSRLLAELVPRFSAVALLSAAVLAVTGAFSAWALIGSVDGITTPYGGALSAKLLLLAPLGVLAGLNLFWIRPQLPAQDPSIGLWLRRFVVAETIVGILIAGAVGWMTGLEPGRQAVARAEAARPTALSLNDIVDGNDITLRLEPGTVGRNDVTVELRDASGNPINDASRVGVRIFYLGGQIIEQTSFALAGGRGRYLVEDMLLNLSGNWEAEITVQRRGAFDLRHAFRFELSSVPPSGTPSEVGPDAAVGRLFWTAQILMISVISIVVVVTFRKRPQAKRQAQWGGAGTNLDSDERHP